MNKNLDKKWGWLEILAAICSVIGLIAIIGFLLALRKQFQLFGDPVDVQATANVGDFIGGVAGAFWSLAGVLLFYSALRLQRREFSLQRNELRNQRQEFAISRITNVIYKQTDAITENVMDIRIELPKQKSKFGIDALKDFTHEVWWYSNEKASLLGKVHASNLPKTSYKPTDFGRILEQEAFKQHLRHLEKSIDICIRLVEQGKSSSDHDKRVFLLDEDAKVHLYLLFSSNMEFETHLRYLQSVKMYYDIALKINHVPEVLQHFQQKIDTTQKMIEGLLFIQTSVKGNDFIPENKITYSFVPS